MKNGAEAANVTRPLDERRMATDGWDTVHKLGSGQDRPREETPGMLLRRSGKQPRDVLMVERKKPAPSDDKAEDSKVEDSKDPLVDRLSHLNWLEPPPEVKQAAWERFHQMLYDTRLDSEEEEEEDS
jgi:hypothetical protein